MNAKRWWLGCTVVLLGCVVPAQAFDPLMTRPEVLDHGVILPGDSGQAACPVVKDFAQPLSLSEAVDLALCNNPQLRASWAAIKQQADFLGEARAAYLPTLNGSLNRTRDEIHASGANKTEVTQNTGQAGLTWRLLDFGGRSAGHEAAKNLLAAAMASHDATLQKLLAAVIQAYHDALTSRAVLRAKEEALAIAGNTLKSAQSRESKGAASRSDALQAGTVKAKVGLERNRAQGEYDKSLSVLRYVLGVIDQSTIFLPPEVEEAPSESNAKLLQDWLEEARSHHPAIIAARSQLEASRERVTVARSAALPSLNLSANYYRNTRPGDAVTSSDTRETTAGLVVSVPIFEGFASTYRVQEAQAQVEQQEATLADTEQQIAMAVVKAHADATAALANLDASATLLKAAQESLEVSQRKYFLGAADVTELLNVQNALADAHLERIRSLAEWRSARLRLAASAGQMGRDGVR